MTHPASTGTAHGSGVAAHALIDAFVRAEPPDATCAADNKIAASSLDPVA